MIEFLPKPDDRIRNYRILASVAFGDAFGAPYECADGQLSSLPIAPHMVPNTRLGTSYGTWTDDTTLNLAGALALIANKGSYCPETAKTQYRRAYRANAEGHVDVGDQSTLTQILKVLPPLGWGSACSEALKRGTNGAVQSSGSGTLMRLPVLGYATHMHRLADLYALASQDGTLTHDYGANTMYGYLYLAVLRASMAFRGSYGYSRVRAELLRAVTEYGPSLNATFSQLEELVEAPRQDWVSYCRKSHATSSAQAVFMSGVSLALRTLKDVTSDASTARKSLISVAMDGCEIGGDTDTRLAIALPLCSAYFEVPSNFEAPDYINALDIALSTYFNQHHRSRIVAK